jgi:hypothetical protein
VIAVALAVGVAAISAILGQGDRPTRATPAPVSASNPSATQSPVPTLIRDEPETWQAWTVDEGRFSLVFPTKPKPIESGIAGSHGYLAYRSNSIVQYLALFVESWGGPPDQALGTLRDTMTGGGPLVSDRKLNAGGLPAEEFVYRKEGNLNRCRAMLAGARSCITCVNGTEDDDQSDGALTFFSSLQWLRGSGSGATPR